MLYFYKRFVIMLKTVKMSLLESIVFYNIMPAFIGQQLFSIDMEEWYLL